MSDKLLDAVVERVATSKRYRNVDRQVIARVVRVEHARGGRRPGDLTKATKKHLHRIYGAYLPRPPRYAVMLDEIEGAEDRRERLAWAMSHHASTRERVPQLEAFYDGLRAVIGEPASVLDLACGMNPLARPWMHLAEGAAYHAFDIDSQLAVFLASALELMGGAGAVGVCDLEAPFTVPRAEAAFLLKTAPCLGISLAELLPRIPAAVVVVSFPTRSLGRRAKGMGASYARQFEAALADCDHRQRGTFEVPGELVYVVQAPASE